MKELTLQEWKAGYDNLAAIGIRTVKLLGGEPTILGWLGELLEHSGSIGIKTAVLSNSLFNQATLEKLVHSGLWGYFASIDSLGSLAPLDKHSAVKSGAGYQMLQRLKPLGVPLLAANVVITRSNLQEVPAIVRRLSDEGFYVNLCTIQHTDDDKREFSKPGVPEDILLYGCETELDQLSRNLLALKREGCRIAVPDSYLRGFAKYGIDCSWKCSDIVQLRIDADGALMLCNEYRTGLSGKYNILTLTPQSYREFLGDWKKERQGIDCQGCYWSCFLNAQDNIMNGKEEFHYLGG